jgi:hypothetical protein
MTTHRRRGGGRRALKTLTVHATAFDSGSSTGTLAIPAHDVGDLLLVHYRSGGTPADYNMPNWQKLATNLVTTIREAVYAKITNGVDEETLPPMPGASGNRRYIWVLRGNRKIKSVSVATPGTWDAYQSTDGNPTPQVIQTSVGKYPQIAYGLFVNENGSAVTPRTWTPAVTSELPDVAAFLFVGIRIWNVGDTPGDTTIDMDDEGAANALASLKIMVS